MIYHIVSIQPSDDARLKRARRTWATLYFGNKVVPFNRKPEFTAQDIGDKRDLPLLKNLLLPPLANEITMLTNDDDLLSPGLPEMLDRVLAKQDTVCSFRVNLPSGKPCYGRDLFAFTERWLRTYADRLPDMFVGEFEWDLCLTALIRRSLGIEMKSTQEFHTLTRAELPLGLVMHETHEAAWQSEAMKDSPAKMWNRLQARAWYAREGLKHLSTI